MIPVRAQPETPSPRAGVEAGPPLWARRAYSMRSNRAGSTVVLAPDGEIARDCKVGEAGVVVVKGPSVTPGYVDPKQNQGVFTKDGYFKSGDLGRFDAEGYLWITGRAKELIISGGVNVYPREIEVALEAHPNVVEVAVFGVPHPQWGETVKAVVVVREPVADLHADEHVRGARQESALRLSALSLRALVLLVRGLLALHHHVRLPSLPSALRAPPLRRLSTLRRELHLHRSLVCREVRVECAEALS
mgnify:CR=1 FL=1